MADRETITDKSSGSGTVSGPDNPLPPPRVGGESVLPRDGETGREQHISSDVQLGAPQAPDYADAPSISSSQPLAIGVASDLPPVAGAGSITAGSGGGKVRIGDRIFSSLAMGSGGIVILLVILVAVFLLIQAVPAIIDDKSNFLFSRNWDVSGGVLNFGVLNLLWTTVVASLIAMLLAVPVAIGIALFITHYAPKRLAKPVAYIVDLLAAIPSIVYGIWGISVLAPHLSGVQRAL
jgi:phosphate transport system permease protein